MRAALLVVLLASPAFADTRGPHREGEYGGVTPGEGQKSPSDKPAKPRRPPPKGTLTWVGFEAKDGGAQIFFQSVAPFEVKQHVAGNTLMIHLSLRRLGHNTWRKVDTRFFDNPLSSIVARTTSGLRATKTTPARGPGILVRVTFKNPKDVHEGTVTTKVEADGMFYAYVTFPEGADGKSTSAPTIEEPEQ